MENNNENPNSNPLTPQMNQTPSSSETNQQTNPQPNFDSSLASSITQQQPKSYLVPKATIARVVVSLFFLAATAFLALSFHAAHIRSQEPQHFLRHSFVGNQTKRIANLQDHNILTFDTGAYLQSHNIIVDIFLYMTPTAFNTPVSQLIEVAANACQESRAFTTYCRVSFFDGQYLYNNNSINLELFFKGRSKDVSLTYLSWNGQNYLFQGNTTTIPIQQAQVANLQYKDIAVFGDFTYAAQTVARAQYVASIPGLQLLQYNYSYLMSISSVMAYSSAKSLKLDDTVLYNHLNEYMSNEPDVVTPQCISHCSKAVENYFINSRATCEVVLFFIDYDSFYSFNLFNFNPYQQANLIPVSTPEPYAAYGIRNAITGAITFSQNIYNEADCGPPNINSLQPNATNISQ